MNFEIDMMCHRCHTNQSWDPDALCNDCRRKEYDNKKCDGCKKKMEDEKGWYVPGFGSYMDIHYYCPDCIVKYQKQHDHKNKRLKEIPGEIDALWEQRKTDDSPIHYVDGEYYHESGEYTSFSEFQEDLDYYKEHRDEIEATRKHNDKISKKIDKLRKEEYASHDGSGFYPMANR